MYFLCNQILFIINYIKIIKLKVKWHIFYRCHFFHSPRWLWTHSLCTWGETMCNFWSSSLHLCCCWNFRHVLLCSGMMYYWWSSQHLMDARQHFTNGDTSQPNLINAMLIICIKFFKLENILQHKITRRMGNTCD